MADQKLPARRSSDLSVLGDLGRPGDLPAGNAWFGFERGVLTRRTGTVDASTGHLLARVRQSDAYSGLIDARMRNARKIAELADLHNLIAEEQQQREHGRWLADRRRDLERVQAIYDHKISTARNDAELDRIKETAVRAARNHEAAQRVKDIEIDKWYSQAQARAFNAAAERQDAAVDLARPPPPDPSAAGAVARQQREQDIATVEHEIELARQRGNSEAAAALANLLARLKGAP
jgi:hypothetical protein